MYIKEFIAKTKLRRDVVYNAFYYLEDIGKINAVRQKRKIILSKEDERLLLNELMLRGHISQEEN